MKLLHYAFRGVVASSNWWSGWYRGKEASGWSGGTLLAIDRVYLVGSGLILESNSGDLIP